tara:strand:+ start:385 stop:645 length:261 start_codon:yes stop_codon:yes gene_type:complete
VAKQKKRYYEVRGQVVRHYKRFVEYPDNVDEDEVRRRMESLRDPERTFDFVHEEFYIGDIVEMDKYDYGDELGIEMENDDVEDNRE